MIEKTLHVAHVPADFPVRFALLTHEDIQYVGYYDANRQMTVASRKLGSDKWTYQPLDSHIGWDSHNYITMAVDSTGRLHVSGNMHNDPLVYFRTETPGDIQTLRPAAMTGKVENRVTYPQFLTDDKDRLIFTYRDGGSGNGVNIYNRYDADTQTWTRLFDQPLFDGQGNDNAYPKGPKRESDGLFHVAWVWRENPDCATNHHLSYARSRDLVNWETAGGEPAELPITVDNKQLWVDPIPVGGGIINGCQDLLIDNAGRPIISYHKSDDAGHMQIYLARFEDGKWVIRPVTDWQEPIEFSGRGTMGFIGISIGNLRRVRPGVLAIHYRHKDHGSGNLFIDEDTLKPLEENIPLQPAFPPVHRTQSDFEGVSIRRASDSGEAPEPGVRYVLQWETLPTNRDKPRTPPLPEPSELKLIKLRQSE